MILGTYHAHTEFCDGKSTAEEMILSAIESGAEEIGLTPHSPIKGETWCMSEEGFSEYKNTLSILKEKYKDKIRVFAGIEEDIISGTDTSSLDYVIGSVHSVSVDGKNLWVDLSPAEVRENVKNCFHNDAYLYVKTYYESVAKIYEKTKCDIIGHFDLITKFIERDELFSLSDERYIKERDKALDVLLQTPALFEVNTGAIARGYRKAPYPDDSVLKKIAESGKPLVINSDSHSKETVLFGIEEQKKRLDSMGIKYVSSLSEVLKITRGI